MELWIRGYRGERLTLEAFNTLKGKGYMLATVTERRLKPVPVEGLAGRPETLAGTLVWRVALPIAPDAAASMTPFDKQTKAERVVEAYLNSQMVNCAEAYPSTVQFEIDGQPAMPRSVSGPSLAQEPADLGREARLFLDDMQLYLRSYSNPRQALEQAAAKADPHAAMLLRFLAETWRTPITPKELPNALVQLAEAKPGQREGMAKQMCGCTSGINPAMIAPAMKQAQASNPLVDSLALANAGDAFTRMLDVQQLPH